jgi:hypothetical protein
MIGALPKLGLFYGAAPFRFGLKIASREVFSYRRIPDGYDAL